MKVVKLNGLKPEIVNLDYSIIKEEMEKCQNKGKTESVESYSKLLNCLEENASAEMIETEVNKIIDADKEKIKELKKEIKKLEKEITILSHFSKRETEPDVLTAIFALS